MIKINAALIPARGGSKSIPLKNVKEINGQPLIYWTVKAAVESKKIDIVYVSTDNHIIKDTVLLFGFEKVRVIDRTDETATDTASTESVMLEFTEKFKFDNIVLIQATSPLLTAKDIDNGFMEFEKTNTDSVLSVVRQKRFLWNLDSDNYGSSLNYDFFNRPRRQDFEGCFVENGAFYITSREKLVESGCRISGNIRICEMGDDTYFEIDEPSDWTIVENLLRKRGRIKPSVSDIKMFLTDCDGCLTDGGMYYSEDGEVLKKFNAKDGMGFQLLRENEIITGIITREDIEIVRKRAEKLKVDILKMGVLSKAELIKELCAEYNINLENVAYIGDDINDLQCIKMCGFSACPNDAVDEVKSFVDFIAGKKGGEGAVREIIDFILEKSEI